MPLDTVITLAVLFIMFGSFVFALGGVSIWQVVSDRRDALARTRRAAPQGETLPEMRRAA